MSMYTVRGDVEDGMLGHGLRCMRWVAEKERWTERQIDQEANKNIDRQLGRQIHVHVDRETKQRPV